MRDTTLVQAEQLLAQGQHGPCDAAWKRRVRDYFSSHQRGAVIAAEKRIELLEEAIRWFVTINDSDDTERDMQSEWASAMATLRSIARGER